MKKEVLKVVSSLLALSMLLPLGGCGKETKDGEIPTLMYYVPGNPQSDEISVEEKLNEITVPLINAKVDLVFIDWGAWSEKMNLMMASQEYFDIASGFALSIPDLVKNGSVLALDEYLEKDATALKESLDQYFWDAATVDGKIYCVPNEQIEGANVAVAVRKDLAEKYGVDMDKINKLTDLEDFWAQIRDNEPDLYPYRISNAKYFNDEIDVTSTSYGLSLLSIDWETGKVIATCYDEQVKKGAKIAYELANKNYFRKDRATVQDDSAERATGRYASYDTWYKPGVEQEEKNATGHDYIVKMVSKSAVSETTPLATNTIISAYTKYPVESVKFVELLNTNKEVYNLVTFGIEGKHYDYVDDIHIKANPDSGYYTNSGWVFGNQFNALIQEGQDADIWEQTKALNDSSEKSPYMGIVFDTSDITLELAQCTKIQQNYLVSRINKAVGNPDEYWDDYVKESQKAGIDKIVECYQKQVDEFMKNKE